MKQRSEKRAETQSSATDTGSVVHVPIRSIRADGGTQVRASLDVDYIEELKLVVLDDHDLPAIDVWYDGTAYWISDGFHRYEAYLRADRETIPCVVHAGTQVDAQWASYAANQYHGLRRSNADKERAVQAALVHPNGVCMSDRAIAQHVGVSSPMVAKYRKAPAATVKDLQSPVRTGRDGRTIDTSNIGRKPTAANPPAEAEDEPLEEESSAAIEADGSEPAPADCPFDADCAHEPAGEDHPSESDAQPEQAATVTDATDRSVPEHLAEVFGETRAQFLEFARKLAGVRNQLESLASDPQAGTFLEWLPLRKSLDEAHHAIKFATPYAVCPYCDGNSVNCVPLPKPCEPCRGSGWVNETVYRSSPKGKRGT